MSFFEQKAQLPMQARETVLVSRQTPPVLPSAHLSQGWFPPRLRTRDMTVLCLISVLLINNVSLVAGGGGATFLYWIISFLAFLIPSALMCAQLYRLFPGEGAVYLWANRALGDFWDTFLGLFCHWLPGVLGLLVSVSAFITYVQALSPLWLTAPWQQGMAEMMVLVVAQAFCLVRPRIFHRILNMVWLAYGSLFVVLGVACLVWLLTGHHPQGDFSVHGWHLNLSQWPLVAVMILCLLGLEVPLNLGAEVVHPSVVERSLKWSTGIIVVGYLLATVAAAVVLPPQDVGNPAFLAEIMPLAFGSPLGGILQVVTNLILVGYFICVTATFNLMFARLLMVASVDRRLPMAMRWTTRHQVPIGAMLAQTGINLLLVLAIYFLVPAFVPSNQEFSLIVFLVVINGGSVIWNLAMIGLFVCGMLLCLRHPRQLVGRWIVPPFLLYLLAVLGIGASCVAIAGTLFAGSPLPQVLSTEDWNYWMLLVVLGSLACGATYSFLVPEAEDLAALLAAKTTEAASRGDSAASHLPQSSGGLSENPHRQPLPKAAFPQPALSQEGGYYLVPPGSGRTVPRSESGPLFADDTRFPQHKR